MTSFKYIVYKEGNQYVSQCLNVDVASCGDNIDEAVKNLNEALELYFEDNDSSSFTPVDVALIGESNLSIR